MRVKHTSVTEDAEDFPSAMALATMIIEDNEIEDPSVHIRPYEDGSYQVNVTNVVISDSPHTATAPYDDLYDEE